MQLINSPVLSDKKFGELSALIEAHLGIKMPPAKKTLVESRLYRRLRALKLNSFDDYCRLLSSDESENELPFLYDAITTNKTDFFREDDHFSYLTNNVLPGLTARRMRMNFFWSAASSSGEEAYTMAMVLHEYMNKAGESFGYRILGTDISNTVLSIARKGIYSEERISTIPPIIRNRYLMRGKGDHGGFYRVKPDIRASVMFHRLNLMEKSYDVKHKFPVIFCRNVLIYFDKQNQEKVINNLTRHLEDDGYLFLGHSESITGLNVPLKSVFPSVYRKNNNAKQW